MNIFLISISLVRNDPTKKHPPHRKTFQLCFTQVIANVKTTTTLPVETAYVFTTRRQNSDCMSEH